MPSPTLSVVVPVYNEEAVFELFAQRLRPALDSIGEPYEVVAVDDGSSDATPKIFFGLRRSWPQLRVIRLRRNSGHQAALTAGLHRAKGRYVASIDADLQDPPEKIPEMLKLAQHEDLDIVYGIREDRTKDSWFKRVTAGAYYRMMRWLVGKNVPHHAGDFRLLSRETVNVLKQLPEDQPVYRLLVPWTGFPSGEVYYTRENREAGKSKYPLSKMVRLAFDSVTSFSAAPLRLATWLGVGGFIACLVMLGKTISAHLAGDTISGWTSLSVAILFLGAVQLICLGLLGEYIGRIYSAIKNRPSYYVASDTDSAPIRNIRENTGDQA